MDEFDALIPVWAAVEVLEEPLAAAEQDGHDRQVQVVDQACAKVLLNCGRATADPDVSSVGGLESSLQRRFDTAVDKWNVVPPCMGMDGRGR